MPLDPENAAHLKPWLVRTLEPICDAEPGALADYILALLKHSAPEVELRKELLSQLEEFLEKECPPFIDTLFTALRTKSYLPYASDSTSAATSSGANADVGIPIPLDALLAPSETLPDRGRKRGYDYDDESRPSKGPRLNDDQFGRYGRQQQGWDRGERGSRMGLSGRADYMDGGMNGSGQPNARGPFPPNQRRGICRDYHNNGYCARGAYCKYSHGDDAVIPAQLFPMNGMAGGQVPFMPMMNGNMPYPMPGGANAAYDPHERIPMAGGSMGLGTGRPQQQRAPLLPRHGEAGSAMSRKPGELPHIQDLTPEMSPEERMQRQQQRQQNAQGGEGYGMAGLPMNPSNNAMGTPMMEDVNMSGPSMPPQQRGGYRGGHRGGGRGTFGGDAASFRPQKRDDKTLVVEKIPDDRLSLGAVNEWFKRFGTVTNVAVDTNGGKALVSFSSHDEAHAAWRSEDAVFGNRFVKVFWHKPKEGHGQMGARMLAASAQLVANFSKDPSEPAPTASGSSTSAPTPAIPIRKPSGPSAASALAAKQQVLETQIAEQKALMAKLGSASPEEKKEIMARLRKLNEEMTAPSSSTVAASSTTQPSKSQSPGPASASLANKSSRDSTPKLDESKKKELLDKELELHNAVNGSGEGEESTEELQAKLAKLKAEAASMGLSDSTTPESFSSPYHASNGPYRGYRGRGRGAPRSYYRGAIRGGPPRGSMKLDNRPKRLLVKGVNEAQVQAVKDWYETTGQLDTVENLESGDLLVSFKSRAAAEQGLAKGSSIATVGPVTVSWYTAQQTNGTSVPKTSTVVAPGPIEPSTSKSSEPEPIPQAIEESPVDDTPMQPPQDEEVGPRGWGDDDDGFGMI